MKSEMWMPAQQLPTLLQGDPSACGLGYVDINSVSFGSYPVTELSQHNPLGEQMGHPVYCLRSSDIGKKFANRFRARFSIVSVVATRRQI